MRLCLKVLKHQEWEAGRFIVYGQSGINNEFWTSLGYIQHVTLSQKKKIQIQMRVNKVGGEPGPDIVADTKEHVVSHILLGLGPGSEATPRT